MNPSSSSIVKDISTGITSTTNALIFGSAVMGSVIIIAIISYNMNNK